MTFTNRTQRLAQHLERGRQLADRAIVAAADPYVHSELKDAVKVLCAWRGSEVVTTRSTDFDSDLDKMRREHLSRGYAIVDEILTAATVPISTPVLRASVVPLKSWRNLVP